MLICALLTNVPDHHSIDEVIRCINVMGLTDINTQQDNNDIIQEMITTILTHKGGNIQKKHYRSSKKRYIRRKKITKNKSKKMKN